jgi:sensor histidine kinase YesM
MSLSVPAIPELTALKSNCVSSFKETIKSATVNRQLFIFTLNSYQQIKMTKRYRLLNVLMVVFVIEACLLLLTIFFVKVLQVPGLNKDLEHIFNRTFFLKQVIDIIFHSLFFYFSLNYFNGLLLAKKNAASYLFAAVFFLLVAFSYFLGRHYALPDMTENDINKNVQIGVYLFSFSISACFFTGLSLLLAYLNNLRDGQKQRKVLEAQKMQLEVDKSQANFKFLKSQINPHFLHNTLNFLYAKSLPYSAELSEGILTLSDIMRYALNESVDNDDKALLKDEIEHVRNVIKINQLRFSNNLNVQFEVNGVINGAHIIPFVLITIVENAFKHGDLQKPEYPIDVKLNVENNRLFFYCRNKKKSGPKEISTGLGLDNIRNRLQFAYGNDYRLLIKDEVDFYTTELTIDKL